MDSKEASLRSKDVGGLLGDKEVVSSFWKDVVHLGKTIGDGKFLEGGVFWWNIDFTVGDRLLLGVEIPYGVLGRKSQDEYSLLLASWMLVVQGWHWRC